MSDFKVTENTKVSSLSLNELKEYKEELDNLMLEYRPSLCFDDLIQFGIEIEYDHFYFYQALDYLKNNYPRWNNIPEQTLPEGGEAVSPILFNNETTWREIAEICFFLRISGAYETEFIGGHIHAGAYILGKNVNNWIRFAKLITAYENIIYRHAQGEHQILREGNKTICYPISLNLKFIHELENKVNFSMSDKIGENIFNFLGDEKYQSFNFKNVNQREIMDKIGKNTIEYRLPNGSYEPVIWQNNINMFINMLIASNKKLDEEYIDYRINKLYGLHNYEHFKYIDEEGALHFADQIFTNDLDKAYFLRQYFKDYEEHNRFDKYLKTKKFIKY